MDIHLLSLLVLEVVGVLVFGWMIFRRAKIRKEKFLICDFMEEIEKKSLLDEQNKKEA